MLWDVRAFYPYAVPGTIDGSYIENLSMRGASEMGPNRDPQDRIQLLREFCLSQQRMALCQK